MNSDILNGLTGSYIDEVEDDPRPAYHPNGDRVIGMLEAVQWRNNIAGFDSEGNVVKKRTRTHLPTTAVPVRKKGELIYVTSDGDTCRQSELVFEDGTPVNPSKKMHFSVNAKPIDISSLPSINEFQESPESESEPPQPSLEEILTPDPETDSKRRALTAGLANFIRHYNLDSPGGEVEKRSHEQSGKTRTYYRTTFNYPSSLDGVIDLYGPTFMLVWFASSIPGFEGEHKLVFTDQVECAMFLKRAFVDIDSERAYQLQVKDRELGMITVGAAINRS